MMRVKSEYRPNEQDYRNELDSIRREIAYWTWHKEERGYQQVYSLILDDLQEKELLLKEALRRPALLPLSKELRNPFDLPPTPDEVEFLKVARRYFDGLKETAPAD